MISADTTLGIVFAVLTGLALVVAAILIYIYYRRMRAKVKTQTPQQPTCKKPPPPDRYIVESRPCTPWTAPKCVEIQPCDAMAPPAPEEPLSPLDVDRSMFSMPFPSPPPTPKLYF